MKEKYIFFFLHLKQDLDLLLPTAQAADKAGLPVRIGITRSLCQSSPEVFRTLSESKLPAVILSGWDTGWGASQALRHCAVLVTASESTARPHRTAYRLTQRANQLGIETFTLQHGFDNIGLNYSDAQYPLHKVSFASKHIGVWGPLNSALHPKLDAKVLKRCIPVGCPKSLEAAPFPLEESKDYRGMLSVFENLHWSRYSDAYRNSFIENLSKSMLDHPDLLFLVRPHPDQRWLSKHPGLISALPPNHLLCDVRKSRWESVTALDIFSVSLGVITTPSTIALDAARARQPVAVAGGSNVDLSRYHPLSFLGSPLDWSAWISKIKTPQGRSTCLQFSDDFVHRVLYNGPVFENILGHLRKWMKYPS